MPVWSAEISYRQFDDVAPGRTLRAAAEQHVHLLRAIVMPIPASMACTTIGEMASAASPPG